MSKENQPTRWQTIKYRLGQAVDRLVLGGRYMQRPPSNIQEFASSLAQKEALGKVAGPQVDRYVELGFHRELRMNEDEYRISMQLPPWARQPQTYADSLNILVLLDPRVLWRRQLILAGVSENDILAPESIPSLENLTAFPPSPYAFWTHDGTKYRRLTSQDARKRFTNFENFSPLIELVALYLQHREFLRAIGIATYGSAFHSLRRGTFPLLQVPYPFTRAELVLINPPADNLHWRSTGLLSSGKELIPLGKP